METSNSNTSRSNNNILVVIIVILIAIIGIMLVIFATSNNNPTSTTDSGTNNSTFATSSGPTDYQILDTFDRYSREVQRRTETNTRVVGKSQCQLTGQDQARGVSQRWNVAVEYDFYDSRKMSDLVIYEQGGMWHYGTLIEITTGCR